LTQNFEKQWWADLAPTVKRDGYGSAIRVIPSLVAAGLSRSREAKLKGYTLELARGSARHE